VATIQTDAGAIRSAGLTDGGVVLGQDDGRLTYFGIEANQGHVQKRFLLRGHEGSISGIACDQLGSRIVAAGDESITIWDVSMPPEMQPLHAALNSRRDWIWDHQRPLRLPRITAVSGPFAVSDPSKDGEPVRFASPVERFAAFTFDEGLTQCAISGDDGGHQGLIYVLRPGSAAPLTLHGHKGHMFSLMFEPGGKRLLSAAQDGTVRVWDTRSGREIKQYAGLRLPVRSRVCYIDDALREWGMPRDAFQLLAAAQLFEKEEVFQQVLDALREELSGREAVSALIDDQEEE
jgi:WD40 repeat protein